MNKTIVVVQGGIVTNVFAENHKLEVEVLDYDNKNACEDCGRDDEYNYYCNLEKQSENMTCVY